MPFLYTTFEEAHRTGVPIFRPLVLNYQEDPNVRTLDDEFMIGDALLVAPVLNADQKERSVYLPPGDWFDFWTRTSVAGGARILAPAPLETVPMFVRAGSIIPTGPDMNYLKEHAFDPLTFDIYLDANGRAAGSYYEDDGLTQAYRNGDFRRTNVSVESSTSRITITIEPTEGHLPMEARLVQFCLAPGFSPASVNVDGHPYPKLDPGRLDSRWAAASGEVIVTIAEDRDGKHTVEIFR